MDSLSYTALAYWRRWLPNAFRSIPDKETFFQDLAALAEQQIRDLADDLVDAGEQSSTFTERLGQLIEAERKARELVYPETIFPPPEDPPTQAAQ